MTADDPGRDTGLFADLYELRMAASYLRHGMTETATFSLFARDLPARRGFLVAAGLAGALDFLERFRFGDADLAWLGREADLDGRTLTALGAMRFTGDVHAVPEGRVVFADEPLLEVTAPLPEAQLVETGLLNAMTHATAIASKAARCRLAADGADLIDFSARRTHGREAARVAARASAIVGFDGTSDTEAARELGVPAVGTMAHSYVQAFGADRDAFRAFATDFPSVSVFLVDTYRTLDGVRAAVDVISELGLTGRLGIRLDSGDLAGLAFGARRILDAAGLDNVRIMASGGLDEDAIAELVTARAPIDSYGIGTRMGTSADAPSLDTAYKLVEYAGRPVMKLSVGKATLPGAKQVWRGPDGDTLGLREEPGPQGHESLLVPVMANGVRTGTGLDAVDLGAARHRFDTDLAWLPAQARLLALPRPVVPVVSERLAGLRRQTAARSGTAAPSKDPGPT
ncbi:nicotinate phosphoribosyltransferase [Catenulispora subtropica]|uniref:Nicotinate phosphoribosyltransferase n=1 Tax=Catenulispora subtropica TaxID=450798 RepID=A0ABN2T9L9_9ACTN